MPNHITNIIAIEPAHTKEVLDYVRSERRIFDFDNILPIPEILKDFNPYNSVIDRAKLAVGAPYHSNLTIASMERHTRSSLMDVPCDEGELEDIVRAIMCYHHTKSFYWHDWSVENWGTKWNAYDEDAEDNIVCFDTAWSHPHGIMIALSKKFPHVQFECAYADEDIGFNCGVLSYLDGGIISETIQRNDDNTISRETWETFAISVKDFKLRVPSMCPSIPKLPK